MSMVCRTLALACVSLLVANILLIPQFDLGQCTRKCRWTLSGPRGMDEEGVIGVRDGPDTCTCKSKEGDVLMRNLKRLYDEYPPGFPYPSKNSSVCGVDGTMYESPQAAARAGVKVINCGPCGDCSNVQDVSIYRTYANPMTKMLSWCALVNLFFGETLSRSCLRYMFATPAAPSAFTPNCENRFIDNYGCVVSHCYRECIYKWNNPLSSSNNDVKGVSHSGQADGTKLNPCLHCDEVHCSPVFISSGGANRRCSGTVTDVARPGDEVCAHVNAL